MTDTPAAPPSELLPCPHCGNATEPCFTDSAELYGDEYEGHEAGWFVTCNASSGHSGCGAATGFCTTKANAIAAWNLRAPVSERGEKAGYANGYDTAIETAAQLCEEAIPTGQLGKVAAQLCQGTGQALAQRIRALKNVAPGNGGQDSTSSLPSSPADGRCPVATPVCVGATKQETP